MKVGLISDLHLEFAPLSDEFLKWRGDILIIAGDLGEIGNIGEMPAHLDDIFSMADSVVWIAGNHEHYRSDLTKTIDQMRGGGVSMETCSSPRKRNHSPEPELEFIWRNVLDRI